MESIADPTRPEQSATSFMGRHFVALACTYESLNPDGSVFHRGTTFLSGFVIDFLGKWYWAGAGHCLQELDERVERRELRVVGGSYIDYLGFKAKHFHGYPYTYALGDGLYLHRPQLGIDFALIPLDGLMQASFQANNVVPIGRENWVHQHRLEYSFYRMLGIPQCCVRDEKSGESGIALALLAIDELREAADGDHRGMLTGRIHRDADIETIEGMSGGPIYGFRFDEQGGLRYHVVAVQSSWLAQQRIVFACPFAIFAERSHQFLLEHGHPGS